MKFDKVTHKVIISTLDKELAIEYIERLEEEADRHEKDFYKAETKMNRHQENIEVIRLLIKQVKERFGL